MLVRAFFRAGENPSRIRVARSCPRSLLNSRCSPAARGPLGGTRLSSEFPVRPQGIGVRILLLANYGGQLETVPPPNFILGWFHNLAFMGASKTSLRRIFPNLRVSSLRNRSS